MITATKNGCPEIGYAGESNACVVSFDCSEYKSKWGSGTPTVMLQRPRERDFYAVGSQEVVGDTVEWTVAREDSMLPGIARVDIWWKSADGDVLGKSGVYFFKLRHDALNTNDPNAPKPWQSYADKIMDAADKVINVELAGVKETIEILEKTKANDSEVKTLISNNSQAIEVLNGDGEGSISKAVTDGIAKVVADAPEDFDTLKEMSDWISNHTEDASAMNTEIKANTAARHTHSNKSILDNITGIVNADNVLEPAHTTDLVDYSAFLAGSQRIINLIPETTMNTIESFIGNMNTIALGRNATAVDTSVALGTYTRANGSYSVAIGSGYDDGAHTSGEYSISIGAESKAEGTCSIAIGLYSCASGAESVALGSSSRDDGQERVISVGNSSNNLMRRIINVDTPQNDSDAATKSYVDNAIQAALTVDSEEVAG